jgi:methylase of polypeptide subunit release factors
MTTYTQVDCGGIRVSYTPALDGGGNDFGRAYLPFLRSRLGRVERVFEWCAGPGFIGFSLLGAGLCDRLDLGDVNTEARAAVDSTVAENGLGDRVGFHLSDCFEQVPSRMRWDLMVGNPPHVNSAAPASEYQHSHSPLIWMDTDWSIHRRFYAGAARHLSQGGAVIIQENHRFSSPDDFTGMIKDVGLEVVGAFECGAGYEDYYFLWAAASEAPVLEKGR